MLVAGKVTGFFSTRFNQMRSFRQEEIELTRAMSHQAMLAIQLIRLSQHNRETAIIAERNRMARDIHDTLAQGFTGVIMQLEAAKGAAERSDLWKSSNVSSGQESWPDRALAKRAVRFWRCVRARFAA